MFLNFLSFILEEDNINDPGTPVSPVSPVSPLTSTTFATPPISPSSLKVNEQKNSLTLSPTLPPKHKQGIVLIVYQ